MYVRIAIVVIVKQCVMISFDGQILYWLSPEAQSKLYGFLNNQQVMQIVFIDKFKGYRAYTYIHTLIFNTYLQKTKKKQKRAYHTEFLRSKWAVYKS